MTKYPAIFQALAEDFTGNQVKWRPQGGKELPFVSARTVMNRLDTVLGPENWWDTYEAHEHSVLCCLTIRLPDGGTLTKSDAGAYAGMADAGDDVKSGHSDAFKRAAVKFGVGRLLYGDGVPDFGAAPPPEISRTRASARSEPSPPPPEIPNDQRLDPRTDDGREPTKGEKLWAWCERHNRTRQAEALSRSNHGCTVKLLTDDQADALYKILSVMGKAPAERAPQGATNANGNAVKFGWPKAGGQLYAWSKKLEEAYHTEIVKSIDAAFGAGTNFDFPRSYKDWSPDQVESAALYVAKLVSKFPGYDGQFDEHIPDIADLKAKLAERVSVLAGHHGQKDPKYAVINRMCQEHSVALEFPGGEVIDDLDQCDNEALIRATLASVDRDIADIAKCAY